MSEQPTDINRERLNGLGTAVADLMESQARQGRDMLRMLAGIGARLGSTGGSI
jgi:hypothetical protein